jgi:hypothetical protein
MSVSKKRTPKASTIKRVKIARDNAWKVFSKYIRLRDGGICVTCGARPWNSELGEPDWKQLQAGHYRHGKFDFDEMNINSQCVRCNKWLSGNLAKYTFYLIDKYGEDAVRELNEKDEISDKRTAEEWDLLAMEYRDKIKAEDWK